jgi:hypothetical protein
MASFRAKVFACIGAVALIAPLGGCAQNIGFLGDFGPRGDTLFDRLSETSWYQQDVRPGPRRQAEERPPNDPREQLRREEMRPAG